MLRDEILVFIYKSKLIQNSAKKITGTSGLHEDLISELILIISETKEGFIKELYERNELELYCYKIMYYQYTNPKMEFFKKYRSYETQVGEIETHEEKIDELYSDVSEIMAKIKEKPNKSKDDVKVQILEMYIELGSVWRVGEQLKCSQMTAHYYIKEITQQIRKEYDLSYNG